MRVTVAGLTQAQERLRAMAARVRDLTPVMVPAAAAIVTLIDDSFRGQRSPDGTPWEPHAPGTVRARLARKTSMSQKRRRAAAGSEKILIDTGRLRASMHAEAGPRSIRFGTNVTYAAPNQLGTSDIPARPFLPVERVGGRWTLMESGPAGQAFQRIRERLRAFITKGTR